MSVYNFYFQSQFGINHHYFNTDVPKKNTKFSYDHEAEMSKIQALAREGFIDLPQPCIAGCEKKTGEDICFSFVLHLLTKPYRGYDRSSSAFHRSV